MKGPLRLSDFIQKTIVASGGLASDAICPPWNNHAADLLLKASNSYAFREDYRTGGFVFFSNSFAEVVNYPVLQLKKGGIRTYTSLIHSQDWKLINEGIFKAICSFLATVRAGGENKLRFIFNYRLRLPEDRVLNIRQINHYAKLDAQNRPLINSGICTLIPFPVPHHKITYLAQSLNENNLWVDEEVKTFMPEEAQANLLSPAELKILQWIRNGYSSEKIAEQLNRSLHTIKTHRKNMLEKTHSRNTAELLQYSLSKGLC